MLTESPRVFRRALPWSRLRRQRSPGELLEDIRSSLPTGLRAEVLGAFLFYLALAWALTWPWGTPDRPTVPGDPRSDVWKHLWGMWWFWSSGGFPTHTDLLGFPEGGSLYNIDPWNSLLAVPLLWLVSLPLAYSLLVAGQLALGGLGGWWLARRFTGDGATAMVAGAGFGFSPFLLCYGVSSGVTETLNLGLVALFAAMLLRMPGRGWTTPVLVGGCLALVSFACWYFGMACLVMAGVAFLVHTVAAGREGAGRTLASYALMGLVFLAAVAPPGLAFYMTLHDRDSLHPRYVAVRTADTQRQYLSDEFHNAARPADFLRPGKGAAVVTNNTDRLIRSPYLGWTLLVLAALAWRGGPWRAVALGWAMAALFAFLAMGPEVRAGPWSVGNPVYLLGFRFLPGFSQVAIPIRFVLFTSLFLSVLAAVGLAGLLGGASPLVRRAAAGAATLLVLLEVALVSPVPFPLPVSPVQVPAFYRALGDQPGAGAVLDLPVEVYDKGPLLPGQYFLYQTVHGRPIPYKVSGVINPKVIDIPLISFLRARGLGLPMAHQPSPELLRQGGQDLRSLGVAFVALHPGQLPAGVLASLRSTLEEGLGKPILQSPQVVVFDLSRARVPTARTRRPGTSPEPDSDVNFNALVPGLAALARASGPNRLTEAQAARVRDLLPLLRAGALAAAGGTSLEPVARAEFQVRRVLTRRQLDWIRQEVQPVSPRSLPGLLDGLSPGG